MESLSGLAAQVLKCLDLFRAFDALGNGFKVQRVAHHDDRPCHGPAFVAVADLVDERFVDLVDVDGKPL
jgi:hypothetical protein